MARTLISCKTQPVTMDLAEWLYSMKRVPRERTIKPSRLSQLANDIERGDIIMFRWAYATLDGENYRVNGQHTSYMFQNGTPIPENAIASLEHYACDSIDDVIDLWSLYDSQVSSRTKVELTANMQESRPAIKDCLSKTVQLCQGALSIERFGFGYTNKVSVSQKLETIRQNEDFVVWADQFMLALYLRRVGITYAMLMTYRRNPTAATAFWKEVVEGSNPDPKSGSRQLQVYALSHAPNSGMGARTNKAKATWNDMASTAITCWNYWRKGRAISRLVRSKEMPDAN